MGAWGYKLYDDDFACDIKEEYINKLKVGQSNNEATQNLIDENIDAINDLDESGIFWFALADTQWKYGRLLPEIKEEALKHIKLENDLERWKYDEKLYRCRKKVLNDLKEKLNTPQPKSKKISKISMNRTPWNIGDILLYQLNDSIKTNISYEMITIGEEYSNKYILFRVVGIYKFNIGSLPKDKYYNEETILSLLNWVGKEPLNVNRVDELILLNNKEVHRRTEKVRFGLGLTKRKSTKMRIEFLTNNHNYVKEDMDNEGM